MSLPSWLGPPPLGLTDAERRALEAFFVAEEVKVAAQLLNLSPKTVQNELLLARQTMAESKSWAASIRYVFYSKRHGLGFAEVGLVPRIDRQVRRLIDDYLETEERPVQQSSPASGPISDDRRPLTEPTASQEAVTSFPVVNQMPAEQFQERLARLTEVATLAHEKKVRQGKAPRRAALLALVATVTGVFGFVTMNLRPMSLDQYGPAIDRAVSAGDMRESGKLTDRLCGRYWQEMWGEREILVVAVMKDRQREISATIDWAMTNDKPLALRILANGHRGFLQVPDLKTKWFPNLVKAVGESNDTSVVMVRALCGVILGTLDEGSRIGGVTDARSSAMTQSQAVRRLQEVMDERRDPLDYANALRHVAMTQNNGNKERVSKCRRAIAIYQREGGEAGNRGVGQCLLSIAQSGGWSAVEAVGVHLDAYAIVKGLGNDGVSRECLQGCKQNVRNAVEQLRSGLGGQSDRSSWRATLKRARTALWEYATQGAGINDVALQYDYLFACYEIDNTVDPSRIGQDLQELVLCRYTSGLNRETAERLAGFAYARLTAQNLKPKRLLVTRSSGHPGSSANFAKGQRLTSKQAFETALAWKPAKGKLE